MTPDMDQFPAAMRSAFTALYGPHKPMTADEIAAFNSAKATVQAADELRRRPSTQADLLDGNQ